MDYPIHDGLVGKNIPGSEGEAGAARNPGGTLVGAGARVWAPAQGEPPIPFEIGEGLTDQRRAFLTLLFSVGPGFQADLDASFFSAALRQEFTDNNIFLSSSPSPRVTVLILGNRWLIHQPAVTFLVQKENSDLDVFARGGNSGCTRTWNTMEVHLPDESQPCLGVGATELFLRGTFPTALQIPADEIPPKFWIGRWLLLKTDPDDPSVPARRHLVRVLEVEQTTDPLSLDAANQPIPITRIKWEDDQALPFEMCLPDMVVRGNLVIATAGETITELFTIRNNQNHSGAASQPGFTGHRASGSARRRGWPAQRHVSLQPQQNRKCRPWLAR